ncbi:acyltransferase family protein, partial [Aequorivita antarctica]
MFGILRTLLALNVVLLHIFNVYTIGNYSVSFFFLLSGFLMTLIIQQTYGYSFKGFKIFWANRFLRLYPIYWVFAAFTIILIMLFPAISARESLIGIPNSTIEWLANITMIFPKIVPHRFNPILLPAAWALTNEILFYFLISIGISKTPKRTILWLILSIGYYIGTYLYYDLETYRYSAIFASSLPFALGASLYWLIKIKPLSNVHIGYIALLYIGFLLNAHFKSLLTPTVSEFSIYLNMLIAFFMVYMLFHLKLSKKWKKWDYYIGMYSYPIYLSHFLVAIL